MHSALMLPQGIGAPHPARWSRDSSPLFDRIGYISPQNAQESIQIAKLALCVEHNALISRCSLRSLHEGKPHTVLPRYEHSISHERSTTDEHNDTFVVRDVVDELMWHREEPSTKGKHMGQARRKRLRGLICLHCRADQGEVFA